MNVTERVRKSLNITSAGYDEELSDIVEAARQDMIHSGVPRDVAYGESDPPDPLVLQAIKAYCKADQAYEDPSVADSQLASYRSIVNKLSLTYQRDGEQHE